MAYFPEKLMPLTPKTETNSSSLDVIRAQDYNVHDQEIQSIEEYLGFNALLPKTLKKRSVKQTTSIFDRIGILSDKVNNLIANGITTTSGFALTAKNTIQATGVVAPKPVYIQKMVAPHIPTTFLTNSVSSIDGQLFVVSTNGFPRKGILTLMSQNISLGSTLSEFISYDGKTESVFLNCKRVTNSTSAATASGSQKAPFGTNSLDDCLLSAGLNVCKPRWPSAKDEYYIQELGLQDTKDKLAIEIMLHPTKYTFDSTGSVAQAASDIGILASVSGNLSRSTFLSQDAYASSQKRLTAIEAGNFVSSAGDLGLLQLVPASSFIVGTDPNPIFSGQLTVSYAPTYWKKTSHAAGLAITQNNFRPTLTGAGNNISLGAIGYQLFHIPTPISALEA